MNPFGPMGIRRSLHLQFAEQLALVPGHEIARRRDMILHGVHWFSPVHVQRIEVELGIERKNLRSDRQGPRRGSTISRANTAPEVRNQAPGRGQGTDSNCSQARRVQLLLPFGPFHTDCNSFQAVTLGIGT
jgi:hypothetical protein